MRSGALLVAGTTSDAGKSLVTVGICRWLARQGVRVAPFKAQNMSNNSMVCADGGEIGRAQWLQAVAAGAEPEVAMNPVLLKPGSDRRSHVVLMGQPHGQLEAGEFATGRRELAATALAAFADLRSRFDVVVAEGAGSPTEINLRGGDYVNMGLARAAGLPVLVVGDVDRGGVLAAMFGTLALLDAGDQAHVAGWVVNKFRGDLDLLRPGLVTLEQLTGRPVLGVLPWLDGVWADSEDALALGGWTTPPRTDGSVLRVAVVRFPRLSNATDLDALALEPGVSVTLTMDPEVVRHSDIVFLPGSRSTVADLQWLRDTGIGAVLTERAVAGRPVLGICGGYQMLARTIHDEVESGAGLVDGLDLLPVSADFDTVKHLGRPDGQWRGHRVAAYEIHHGVVRALADDERTAQTEPFLDGVHLGAVWGTTWHGAFENDAFRQAWLAQAAASAGVDWRPSAHPGFRAAREQMIDSLADAVEQHLDTDQLWRLIENGAPPGLRVVPPAGR